MNNPASPSVARFVAACFALSAFAIALFAGLFGGNDALTVLVRALMAVMVCYPVGFFAGVMADLVIREQLAGETDAPANETDSANPAESSTPSAVYADSQPVARGG